jgi:ribosome maturation factor RimP
MEIVDQLKSVVEKSFALEGLGDCFLVELNVWPSKKVEVFIDSDGIVTFEKCKQLSRIIEAEIEEKGWFGEKYTLDVSSAGVGRPLVNPRQYKKNIGRNVEIKLAESEKLAGVLTEVKDDKLYIKHIVKRKEGKKNVKEELIEEVNHADIIEIKVKISFK